MLIMCMTFIRPCESTKTCPSHTKYIQQYTCMLDENQHVATELIIQHDAVASCAHLHFRNASRGDPTINIQKHQK